MTGRDLFVRAVLSAAVILPAAGALAVGISIDAGLTPPQDRWMLRSQVRFMSREAPGDGAASMDRMVIPLVAAYGLRPQWTLGARQVYDARTMTRPDGETENSGLGDLYLFAKYRALRINTRDYTLGIAPVVGLEPPTGSDGISSESWDLNAGLLLSGRTGPWGADLELRYGWRGFAGVADGEEDPGDELAVNLALARQVPVGASGRVAIAPVLEVSWSDARASTRDGSDVANTGRSVLSLAPGLKYTRDDLIVEGLVRFPVAQEQAGPQLEDRPMYLLGLRRMF